MTPSPFMGPMGPLPVVLLRSSHPPSNHVQSSSPVYLPPGPNGPGFISDSPDHFPAKASSFFVSGPGLGGAEAWASMPTATPHASNTSAILDLIETPPLLAGHFRGLAFHRGHPVLAVLGHFELVRVGVGALLDHRVAAFVGLSAHRVLVRVRPSLAVHGSGRRLVFSHAVEPVPGVGLLRGVVAHDADTRNLSHRP